MKLCFTVSFGLVLALALGANAADICTWPSQRVEYGRTGNFGVATYLECSNRDDLDQVADRVSRFPHVGSFLSVNDTQLPLMSKVLDSLGYEIIGPARARKSSPARKASEFCLLDADSIICTDNADATALANRLTPRLPYAYGSENSGSFRLSAGPHAARAMSMLDDLGYSPTKDDTLWKRSR